MMLPDPLNLLTFKQHPRALAIVNPFLTELQTQSWNGSMLVPLYAYRDPAIQQALYMIGREPGDTRKTVTKAQGGHSYHNYGLAWDFALWDGKVGRGFCDPAQPNGHPCWAWLSLCANKHGLRWGGNFPAGQQDMTHVELPFGLSIASLLSGFTAGGWDAVEKLVSSAP